MDDIIVEQVYWILVQFVRYISKEQERTAKTCHIDPTSGQGVKRQLQE